MSNKRRGYNRNNAPRVSKVEAHSFLLLVAVGRLGLISAGHHLVFLIGGYGRDRCVLGKHAPRAVTLLTAFVELLADHLDERHALHNTREAFARDFAAGKFEALIVERWSGKTVEAASEVVASAIFYEAYSTWDGPYIFLEDVYVLPSMRGKGVGTHLFRELAWRSAARGHRRLQWEALVANTAACGWYGDAIQAARKDEIVIWRLEESGTRRLCEM